MRKPIIYTLLAAITLSSCQTGGNGRHDDSDFLTFDTTGMGNMSIHMETQKMENGYGYVIAVNGKKTIAQTVIPVVEGNYQFSSAKDAFAIGRTAARRMAQSANLPSITIDDLIEAGIADMSGKVIKN